MMYFYQATLPTITKETLIDAILRTNTISKLEYCSLHGYSNAKSLEDALDIIEAKRVNVLKPYNHTFLCIDLSTRLYNSMSEFINQNKNIATAINKFYDNDLFIISLVYKDNNDYLHSILVISDMECSLEEPTTRYLSEDILLPLINDTSNDTYYSEIFFEALYSFLPKEPTKPLAYDGVLHIKPF